MSKTNPQEQFAALAALAATMPTFRNYPVSNDELLWLGRLHARVEEFSIGDGVKVATLSQEANTPLSGKRAVAGNALAVILYRALAAAEAAAPAAPSGAFIAVGHSFDAVSAIGRVLQQATMEVLIVDPYMDEKALTSFAPLANEGVVVKLLADKRSQKPSLIPAANAWVQQYAVTRPLQLRVNPARQLHDRLIVIDGKDAYTLTQSLNAFAARSPASVLKVDAETADLKVASYDDVWNTSEVIIP